MTRARELSRLGNPNIIATNSTNLNVGIGSLTPDSKLDVDGNVEISGVCTFSGNVVIGTGVTIYESTGIISATKFIGDGSELEGAAGLGTALSSDKTSPLSVVYYTNSLLAVTESVDVTVPSGSNVCYTPYTDVRVDDTYNLTVADGDDFITDIFDLGV